MQNKYTKQFVSLNKLKHELFNYSGMLCTTIHPSPPAAAEANCDRCIDTNQIREYVHALQLR